MGRIEFERFALDNFFLKDATDATGASQEASALLPLIPLVGISDALEMFLAQTGLQSALLKSRLQSSVEGQTNAQAGISLDRIQGVRGNPNVTPEFVREVEAMARRLGTRPEYIMAVMSFESGGSFSPAKENRSTHATGLIQFMPDTARGMLAEEGVNVSSARAREIFAAMKPVEQLRYVEKYLAQRKFNGRLGSLEGVYTAVLSGHARQNPNDVVFGPGISYNANAPLDWDGDGQIIAAEATSPVAFRLFGGVANVQQRLQDLGYLQEKRPDGRYGPGTRAALEHFQRDHGLNPTGLMDEATGRALGLGGTQEATQPQPQTGQTRPDTATTGNTSTDLRRGSRGAEVERLQDSLVALGYMTAAQKATGPGIFGQRTEHALKAFQRNNGLQPSGVLDAETYRKLHSASARPMNPAGNERVASGNHYTVNAGVHLSDNARERIGQIADEYFNRTGHSLRITDGTRTAQDQAERIYDKILANDTGIYRNQTALAEIRRAYDAGVRTHRSRAQIVNEMAAVIQDQMGRGVYISRHLRAGAVDVSVRNMTARDERAFRESVAAVGGVTVLRETRPPHFHLQF
jgi:peptidoglycan hydrolase-like protein with peptidoglycan-binding domain